MSKLLISALAVGICSFGWAQSSAPAKAAAPLEDASAFMARVKAKLAASSTVSGTLEVNDKQVQDIKFKAMRPNLISLVMPEFELHGDGKSLVMYVAQNKMYMTVPPSEESHMFGALVGFEPVLGLDAPYTVSGKAKPTFFRGAKAVAITIGMKSGPANQQGFMYFDADTLQPLAFGGPDGKTAALYKDVVLGTPMKAQDFAWTPPADAKSQDELMKEAMAAQAAQAAQAGQKPAAGSTPPAEAASDPTAHLLKEGTSAPDFTLKTPTGGTLTLSKSLGKRATIINFWADFCGPCHAEMPLFVKLYKELKPQGLELISVDDGDDAATIMKDAKENGFNYLLAMNGKDKMNLLDLYGVDAFPTNYVLDANGKIITTIVGFDEDAVRAALKKAGFTLASP